MGNDPIYGAFADGKAALPELLGNDFGGSFRIEETVAQGLTDDLLGSTIVGLGASSQAQQCPASALLKKGPELVVALAAVTEFGGRFVGSIRATLSLHEHGQLAGDFVLVGNGKRAELTADEVSGKLDPGHGDAPSKGANCCLFKYGTPSWQEQQQNKGPARKDYLERQYLCG